MKEVLEFIAGYGQVRKKDLQHIPDVDHKFRELWLKSCIKLESVNNENYYLITPKGEETLRVLQKDRRVCIARDCNLSPVTIPNLLEYYTVCAEHGQVFGKHNFTLKQSIDKNNNRLTVHLRRKKDGKSIKLFVHTLVYKVSRNVNFIPWTHKVVHKDDDLNNNNFRNLELVRRKGRENEN